MKDDSVILLDENGLRTDGRRPDELRPISITAGVSNRADGSAYLEWGGNKVMAAVYGPRETHPRHKQETDRARVAFRYNMAPFSVGDRKRPGPDRRSYEISKVASEAFSNVVFLNEFPRSTIDVVVEILQADAGTRCAAVTCASVALADAGIPMKDMLVSCAAGKINGKVVLDMHNIEDNKGEGDVPLAVVPSTGEIVLLQMDGELTPAELEEAMDLIMDAVPRITQIQKEALRRKYEMDEDEKELASSGERSGLGEEASRPATAPAVDNRPAAAPVSGRRPPWLATAGRPASPPAKQPPSAQALGTQAVVDVPGGGSPTARPGGVRPVDVPASADGPATPGSPPPGNQHAYRGQGSGGPVAHMDAHEPRSRAPAQHHSVPQTPLPQRTLSGGDRQADRGTAGPAGTPHPARGPAEDPRAHQTTQEPRDPGGTGGAPPHAQDRQRQGGEQGPGGPSPDTPAEEQGAPGPQWPRAPARTDEPGGQ